MRKLFVLTALVYVWLILTVWFSTATGDDCNSVVEVFSSKITDHGFHWIGHDIDELISTMNQDYSTWNTSVFNITPPGLAVGFEGSLCYNTYIVNHCNVITQYECY
jgi:hypothetical protein